MPICGNHATKIRIFYEIYSIYFTFLSFRFFIPFLCIMYVLLVFHPQWWVLLFSASPIWRVCRVVACCTHTYIKKFHPGTLHSPKRGEAVVDSVGCKGKTFFWIVQNFGLFMLFLPKMVKFISDFADFCKSLITNSMNFSFFCIKWNDNWKFLCNFVAVFLGTREYLLKFSGRTATS